MGERITQARTRITESHERSIYHPASLAAATILKSYHLVVLPHRHHRKQRASFGSRNAQSAPVVERAQVWQGISGVLGGRGCIVRWLARYDTK